MKQKTKMCLKLGILFFGISLCVVNCQQDDLISNYQLKKSETEITVKKLSLIDLQQKQKLQKPLQKLAKVFDINKNKASSYKTKGNYNARVDANDGSFTILTDEIVQVTTDSTETYSFLIETPTVATSEFENFILT